jgi:hypothetical protein
LNKSKTLIAIVDLRAASKVSGIHPIVGVRNHQGVSDIDSQVLVTTNGELDVLLALALRSIKRCAH